MASYTPPGPVPNRPVPPGSWHLPRGIMDGLCTHKSHHQNLYQDVKPCMLVFVEPAPHFSRGYAGKRIGHLLFATHPHHTVIRELTPARASYSRGERGNEKGPGLLRPDPATRQCLLRGLRQEVEVLVASAAKGNKVLEPFLCVRFIRPMMNV
jgi:hypothetical protein